MNPCKASVSGVAIYVSDLERLVAFYATVLGLDVAEQDDGYVVLTGGAGEVSLVAMPREIAESLAVTQPPELREDTPIKPVFVVSSIEDAVAAASSLGGGAKPAAAAWEFRGLRRLDAFDPEGNVLQLAQVLGLEG